MMLLVTYDRRCMLVLRTEAGHVLMQEIVVVLTTRVWKNIETYIDER